MAIFNYIYNGINKCFSFLLNLTSVSFYAVIMIALYLLVVIIGFIACYQTEEARSLRALKRINQLCLKQAKKPKQNFYTVLNNSIKKGNNRVSLAYKDFLKRRNVSITKTLNDQSIYSGYQTTHAFLDKSAIMIALFMFVLILGSFKAEAIGTAEVLFTSLAVPFVILLLNYIFSAIIKKLRKNITEDLFVFRGFVSDAAYDMLEGNEDYLFEAEDAFLKTKKGKKQISKTEALRDPNRKSKIIEANTKKDNIVLSAEFCEKPGYNEAGRDLRDFDFLEENLDLVNEKEKIEEELRRAKWEVEENEQDLNKDIKTNTDELNKVRKNIKETNDDELAKNLKRQESFQVKLLDALEKLKKSQYQSYLETESKLKAEIAKIDEELAGKKIAQSQEIDNEVNNFASNLKQDLNKKDIEADIESDRKEVFLDTSESEDEPLIISQNVDLENINEASEQVVEGEPTREEIEAELVKKKEMEEKTKKLEERALELSAMEQKIYERKQKLDEEEERINNVAKNAIEEKTVAQKALAEKTESERLLSEKLAAEKALAERIAAERLSAEKLATERLVAERLANEKALSERLAAERLANEKVLSERVAAEKQAAEKLVAQKAAIKNEEELASAATKPEEVKAARSSSISSSVISEKKQNINNALTDLLDAMNKYQTKNKK